MLFIRACANQRADKNLPEAEEMENQALKDFSGNKATQTVTHKEIISLAILTFVNHPPGGTRPVEYFSLYE